MKNLGTLLCSLAFLAAVSAPQARGQNFGLVPGVVIDYEESPTLPDHLANINEVYIASPSITIMPNGYYIASHDLFDSGTNYDTTKIFLSTDKGATWSHRETIVGQFWSTVLEHNGGLYIFGPRHRGGDLIIRKSADYGDTWTEPTSSTTGLLRKGHYGGTPNAPVVHGGRIWIAQSSSRVASAPAESDLLDTASWKLSGGIPRSHGKKRLGSSWQDWSEAQAVASPRTGVVLMPKIRGLPRTALIQVDETTGEVSFDGAAENAFPSLPGGEKKFGVRYDPVSQRFFVLSNPVLPLEAAHPEMADKPEMARNTAGVLSSKDLVNWNVEKLFLYSPNIDDGTFGEGFQYFNFAIDDDDLAVVARTAFDVADGQNKPPRGHDTNLMTFHRIKDFRNLSPEHVLVVDTNGNRVLRYEETQHKRAPLGPFALGSTFDGDPLTGPVGLAQDAEGDVYIREQAGRTLCFDGAGNFKHLVASTSGLPAETGREMHVTQPVKGECSWIQPKSGEWFVATNWYYWGRPDTVGEVAVFGSAAVAECTISLQESFTVQGLRFHNDSKYTLDGSGSISIASKRGHGILEVQRGDHEIRVALKLKNATDIQTRDGTRLKLSGPFALEGRQLRVGGSGRIEVCGRFSMGKGSLAVSKNTGFAFEKGVNATLDGTLLLLLDKEVHLQPGDRFKLIEGIGYVSSRFDAVSLPKLPEGLSWDTSSLYDNGTVAISE